MKIIKSFCCIIMVILVCSLSGCGFFGEQSYTCDVENVKCVQIVKLGDYNQESLEYEHTVLCEIEDYAPFIKQLISMEQSVNWGDPGTFHTGEIVIYIEYTNGDYDRISANAQTKIREGKSSGGGYIFFDKEQFDSLLNRFLQNDE